MTGSRRSRSKKAPAAPSPGGPLQQSRPQPSPRPPDDTWPGPGQHHHLLEDLLLRCAELDQAAFAEFYRLTSPALRAIALRRTGSPRLVDAVLVSIYPAIWRRAGEFNYGPVSSAWEWTLTILNQVLADQAAPAPRPESGTDEPWTTRTWLRLPGGSRRVVPRRNGENDVGPFPM